MFKPTEEMSKLLRMAGASDPRESERGMKALAAALMEPLRSVPLAGDILGGIFVEEPLGPGATAEYPLDFYQPGREGDYIAYTIPSEGAIPCRSITSDKVTVPTYSVANAIDWPLKYSRDARWPVVSKALALLEAGVAQKLNTDGWRTIIAAGAGRGVLIYDANAAAGQFTKRLVSLMKTQMRRLAGGNSTSIKRGRLSDLFLSPEALEDIREWGSDTTEDNIDPVTMREIFTADGENEVLSSIYGVKLHTLDELGEGQEFQKFFDITLGGSMGSGDKEICVGLDLTQRDSFVMPIREPLSVFDDPQLHRRQRAGFYAWAEIGFAVLDDRRVLIGSF
jgi:hypothetical protein